PIKPRTVTTTVSPPVIQQAEVKFQGGGSTGLRLELTGKDFTLDNPFVDGGLLGSRVVDLFVTIEVGGRDFFDTDGDLEILGGKDIIIEGDQLSLFEGKLTVPIPSGAMIGGTTITVNRPMNLPTDGTFQRQIISSNPIIPSGDGRYGFSVSARDDVVTVLNLNGSVTSVNTGGPQRRPQVVAHIPLGVGTPGREDASEAPRKSIPSADGSLLYVTLEKAGAIAVVDAVGLQEVDTVPLDPLNPVESVGIQPIKLLDSATPFDLTTDPNGDYLFISDRVQSTIYVVDIDRFSPTFHQLLGSVNLGAARGGGVTYGLLGLRGIAVSSDGKNLFVAAPAQDVHQSAVGQQGAVLRLSLEGLQERSRLGAGRDDSNEVLPLSFNPEELGSVIPVGPAPFEITATEDADVVLVTDRVNDRRALGVIRASETVDGIVEYNVDDISVVNFGRIPRLVEGRDTHAFAVSNVSGVTYVPENAFQDLLADNESDGSHPAYALVTGYNALQLGDPKKDPGIAPFQAYNVFFDPERDNSFDTVTVPVGAGGTIGIIRNPLGDFDDTSGIDVPRIVAATRPIQAGFPDDIAASLQTGTVIAPFQAIDSVFAYDLVGIINQIESTIDTGVLPVWSQFPEDQPAADPAAASDELSRLLRGPLSTVPIDALNPNLAIAADYRYFGDVEVGYGFPPVDPFGGEPNNYLPVDVNFNPLTNAIPRGVSVQPELTAELVQLASTPFGQQVGLQAFPTEAASVEAGRFARAEVHTGALSDVHELVTYTSQNTERSLTLQYDSLRAEPRTLQYFQVANLAALDLGADDFLSVGFTAINGDLRFRPNGVDADDPNFASSGLVGGEALFKQGELEETSGYGAGVPIDFREAPTGLYNLRIEAGVLKNTGSGYRLGSDIDQFEPLAVVNGTQDIFGAGWGLAGLLRLYAGPDGALLVDGTGTESIFLSPQ
ncbi:MAG: hypothetical protein AAF664_24590, partial [Planctomycetota bacterium]